MKKFFKIVGASFVGSLLSLVILLFLLFGVVGSLASLSDSKPTVPKSVILVIDGSLNIAEQSVDNPFAALNPMMEGAAKSVGLYSILEAIERGAEDPSVKLLYLDFSTFGTQPTYAEELRTALEQFRKSGKPIIAYGDNYSQTGYYVATVADRVYLNPTGSIPLRGLNITTLFFKNLLEAVGIEMELVRHGKFKSAGEQFIADKMSPENREQLAAYINSVWGHWVEKISEAREISVEEINYVADNLLFSSAEEVLEAKLVDELLYKDEMREKLMELFGVEKKKELKTISLTNYQKATEKPNIKIKDKIAILYANGEIIMGSSNSAIASNSFSKEVEKVREDSTIKAVVLRINSPGGSATSSDIIERELSLLRKDKPVVVSMGEYAASGGYWIAAKGDAIVANHTTLTGSIGVFSMVPNLHKAMKKHLKLHGESVNTNQFSDLLSTYRGVEAEEIEFLRKGVERWYTQFIELVAEGREMEFDQVDEIAQGRIWSGIDGSTVGLVDKIGGVKEALSTAAELAELENYRVVQYPYVKSSIEIIMEQLGNASATLERVSDPLRYIRECYEEIAGVERVTPMTRLPFHPLVTH